MVENKAVAKQAQTLTKAEMFEYNKQQRVAFIKSKMLQSRRRCS
jgi:hypothetical protein